MSLSTFNRLYKVLRMNVYSFLKAAGWPEPTHQQREILDDIQRATIRGEPYYGCAKSGQGVGKTNIEAGVALWRAS
jgi:hypothetical protein